MHEIRITETTTQRMLQTKGKEFAYEDIDLGRTAHLVIDMQNGFVEEGAPIEVPVAREIVDNVNAISAAVREGGGVNVFFRFTVDPADDWSVYLKNFGGERCLEGDAHAFRAGSHNHGIYPKMDVTGRDLVMDKTRFSAFTPASSSISDLLADRDIDTIIVTGTLTNCCCESTARDAAQLNLKVIFVSDANAALTDEAHNGTLNSLAPVFADVMPTEKVLDVVANGAITRQPAAIGADSQ